MLAQGIPRTSQKTIFGHYISLCVRAYPRSADFYVRSGALSPCPHCHGPLRVIGSRRRVRRTPEGVRSFSSFGASVVIRVPESTTSSPIVWCPTGAMIPIASKPLPRRGRRPPSRPNRLPLHGGTPGFGSEFRMCSNVGRRYKRGNGFRRRRGLCRG